MLGWMKKKLRQWLGIAESPKTDSDIIYCWDVKPDKTRISQPYRISGLAGGIGLMAVSMDGTTHRCIYCQDAVEPEVYWSHIRKLRPELNFEWEDLPPPQKPV